MCYFGNLHNNHKLLRIDDEEALKKENISVDISTKDLDENKNKIEELKIKILFYKYQFYIKNGRKREKF